MKIVIALCVFVLAMGSIHAQVAINTDGSTPDVNAILDVKSFNKGILIPRTSFASINSMVTAKNGTIIYDTTYQRFRVRVENIWRDVMDSRSWTRNTSITDQVVYTFDSVGVGTSVPGTKLHINGSGQVLRLSGIDPQMELYQSNVSKGFVTVTGDDFKIGTLASNDVGKAIIRVNGGDRLTVAPDGNVGIGNNTPLAKLHIASGADASLTTNGFVMLGSETAGNIVIDNNEIVARNNGATSTLFLQNNGGPVQIGSTAAPTGYLLSVAGKAICTELRVQLTGAWPDYVFGEQYQLPSFDHLRQYIQQNKHLPNIPAAKDVENSGIEVGDMQRRMMEKIEELTLYILELEKKVSALEKKQ